MHPSDQMSVLSSISVWLGQSHSSGARKGAEQCSDAHSYIVRQVVSDRLENPSYMTENKLCFFIFHAVLKKLPVLQEVEVLTH